MNTHQLKYNADSQSGFVRNKVYPKGYVFEGLALKPSIGFEYESLGYDTIFNIYVVTINGATRDLTELEKIDVLNACSAWTDTTYIGTDEALSIKKDQHKEAMLDYFNNRLDSLAPNTPAHEMVSWQVQEEEALAWSLDNLAPTPSIDALISGRNLGEEKSVLVDIIIGKAAQYRTLYYALLGKYHSVLKRIDACTTELELKETIWM